MNVPSKETHMQTHFIPRLLISSLLLAFIFAGASNLTAGAKSGQADLWGDGLLQVTDWTETHSQEDVLVQSCDGFAVTDSNTANIAHHLTSYSSGGAVLERLNVDFAGSIGNSLTGKSYQYDGHFTRWSDYIQNKVTINDLELRFEVGTPGEFAVAVDRIEMDLAPNPAEVIKQFVPNALQMELCYVLADTSDESVSQSPRYYADVEESETASGYGESSVLIPPASYQSGNDAGTCELRRGYPQDCLP
jgi:hypothetical protein